MFLLVLTAIALAAPPPDPPVPAPAPGETHVVAPGNASEDDKPASAAEQAAVLAHLRAVAACARARGVELPDPVVADGDVTLGWTGDPRPDAEAALAACDPAVGGALHDRR
jgi:hypothetical protein